MSTSGLHLKNLISTDPDESMSITTAPEGGLELDFLKWSLL